MKSYLLLIVAIVISALLMVSCGGGGIGTASAATTNKPVESGPTISAITPDTATVSTDVTVQVSGSGFDNSSVLLVNNNPTTTSYISSSSLKATVSGTALSTSGDANVTVSNTSTKLSSNALKIRVVKQLSIVTAMLPTGTQGSGYQTSLAASGGSTPYSWSGAGLPPGMSVKADGTLTGTPTAPGNYQVSLGVKDSSSPSKSDNKTLSLQVMAGPLALSSPNLPAGTSGVAYSGSLSASGGITPYKWSVTSGSLPAGLTLSASSGVISGTPTATGTSNFTVGVTDSSSTPQSLTTSASIAIAAAPLTITSSSLPGGTTGTAYNGNMTASGGTKPYTWSVTAGSLPAGLMLATSTGVISGTPTTSGSFNFTLTVADSSATVQKQSAPASIAVAVANPLSITTTSLPSGTQNTAYTAGLQATGGTAPYSWSLSSGSLPAGLTLASTGTISGIATASGTYNVVLAVKDSTGASTTKNFALTIAAVVALQITTASLPDGVEGAPYNATLAATGGTAPYTWSISAGSIPSTISLAATTGVLNGTPSATGSYNATFLVTDAAQHTASKSLPFAVAANGGVPNQFAGLLLNDATDYTTVASAWISSALPAAGSCSSADATWKTKTCRIPAPTDCPGACSTTNFVNDYSKTVPWSVDDAYFVAMDGAGWLYLYSVNNGVYSFIRRLQTGSSVYGATRDYGNGYGLYGDHSNWVWANNPSAPHIIYYTGSSSTNGNRAQLKAYNVDTDTITVVKDFTSTIAQYTGGLAINNEREGNASEDDRYWAFTVNDSRGDNGGIALLAYDKQLNTVVSKTLGANGICGASACPVTPNWVGMSPSGNYVIVNWNGVKHDSTWVRGYGTEAFRGSDLAYLGGVEASNSHADVGYDVNGNEVYVTMSDGTTGWGYNEIAYCNLAYVNPNVVGSVSRGGCQKTVQLPCSWDYAGAGYSSCNWSGTFRNKSYTISTRANQGSGKGWMLFSMMDTGTTNVGVGGWGAMENIAIKIDWNAGSTINNDAAVEQATFVRLGRTHGQGGVNDYSAQPNGVPNRSFTKFAWTSNWDTNTSNGAGPYYSLFTDLTLR